MAILRVKDGEGWHNIPAIVGATPNLQIGTVETLEAGSEATASMGGTAENPLLNLGIPKGPPGEIKNLPIATETTLGGVQPVAATEDMTQPVGVNPDGRLFTSPGEWQIISDTILEESAIINTGSIQGIKEMLFLYAAPPTPDDVITSGNGNSFGANIYYYNLTNKTYGSVGLIFGRKFGTSSVVFFGTFTTGDTSPSIESVYRIPENIKFACTAAASDTPLLLHGAFPAGTKIKLQVR